MSKENRSPEVMDYLREFVCALTTQLKEDNERWGDTWLKREKEGQELRTEASFNDYFDRFKNAGIPMPWLKVIGGALICWIRENHPEVCPDVNEEEPHPMLCFQHGGSQACEEINSKHGFVCPKCKDSNDDSHLFDDVARMFNENAALDVKKAHDEDLDRRVEKYLNLLRDAPEAITKLDIRFARAKQDLLD